MNRRIGITSVLATLAVLGLPSVAGAQLKCGLQTFQITPTAAPSVVVCVNNTSLFNLPGILVDGKRGVLRTTTIDLGLGTSFSIGASFNSDPFSNFTFGSVIAGGNALTFDVWFTTPVIGGPYNTATSQFNSSLAVVNGQVSGPGGATTGVISQGNYPFYVSGFTNLTMLGIDVGQGSCTLSAATSVACASGTKTDTFGPNSPTTLTTRLTYSHSTTGLGSSQANFMGGVEISNVTTTVTPEPSTAVMLFTGLLLLGMLAERRRRLR